MADQTAVYREALLLLGDNRLGSVSDNVPARHALDDEYARAMAFVLRQAPWKFALKQAALSSSGTPISGYSTSYAKPGDWARTVAIFVLSGARECPIDCRDIGVLIHANTTPTMRYVQSGVAITDFPEQVVRVLTAYLAFLLCNRITGYVGKAEAMFALYQRHLAEAVRLDAVPEDPWLEHQLDGSFLASSRFVLTAANWEFAMKPPAVLTAEGSPAPAPGFATSYAKPADFVRLQSIFALIGTREIPIDVREHGTRWSSNTAPYIRYVSTDGLNATLWPEDVFRAVAAHLGLAWGDGGTVVAPGSKEQEQANRTLWPEYLQAAIAREAIPDSPWLPFQRDGRFRAAGQFVFEQAFWKFAIKTATLTDSGSGSPTTGYSYNFVIPADHLKTHALFVRNNDRELPVDVRESDGQWSCDTASIEVRYLSSALTATPTAWTERFLAVVGAYLGIGQPEKAAPIWPALLQEAARHDAYPVNPWLEHQLDGSMHRIGREFLNSGNWRFAIKTVSLTDSGSGSPSVGYSYNYDKPADFVRTFHFGYQNGTGPGARIEDVDYRDEAGQLHANWTPVTLRYVSSDGYASTAWSDLFSAAVLARLRFDKGLTQEDWRPAFDAAREYDDIIERPKIFRSGSVAAARRGVRSFANERGWQV